jgi:putative ABC transport system substrate-binding protein
VRWSPADNFGTTESISFGGLMAYGPSLADLFRRAGDHVDKILRGAKPGDIPVEQPTKFSLVINLITAKAWALMSRRPCSPRPIT